VRVNHFCTISTVSHLYKVYALAESLANQKHEFVLHVLVSDSDADFAFANCRFWKLSDFKSESSAQSIMSKYKSNSDKLRWSLKPVFLKFLVSAEAEQVIYIDNDVFFYSEYQLFFQLLNEHSLLLTPHYYKHNPKKEQNWLEANFRVGLYNAGFIGASKKAINTLQWWADCCEYRCEKNSWRGLFDDQKYLDLIPVIDEGAHIVRHKGCNVASWNKDYCERKTIDGELKINGKYPVVFIHFNPFTIREIAMGRDALLLPLYNFYTETLKKYMPDLKTEELQQAEPLSEKLKYYVWKLLTDLGI